MQRYTIEFFISSFPDVYAMLTYPAKYLGVSRNPVADQFSLARAIECNIRRVAVHSLARRSSTLDKDKIVAGSAYTHYPFLDLFFSHPALSAGHSTLGSCDADDRGEAEFFRSADHIGQRTLF